MMRRGVKPFLIGAGGLFLLVFFAVFSLNRTKIKPVDTYTYTNMPLVTLGEVKAYGTMSEERRKKVEAAKLAEARALSDLGQAVKIRPNSWNALHVESSLDQDLRATKGHKLLDFPHFLHGHVHGLGQLFQPRFASELKLSAMTTFLNKPTAKMYNPRDIFLKFTTLRLRFLNCGIKSV